MATRAKDLVFDFKTLSPNVLNNTGGAQVTVVDGVLNITTTTTAQFDNLNNIATGKIGNIGSYIKVANGMSTSGGNMS